MLPYPRLSSTFWHNRKKKPSRGRKKRSLKSNGRERVTVRTRHGAFVFVRRRLRDRHSGQEISFLPSLVSEPLRRSCLFWANRLSFGEVARLVTERCGVPLISEDSI